MGRASVGQSWVARVLATVVIALGLAGVGTVPSAGATVVTPGVRAVVAPQGPISSPANQDASDDAVSCPEVGACVGVGVATDLTPGGPLVPVAYRQVGKSLKLTVLPRPAGRTIGDFVAVSCPTTSWCLALGQVWLGSVAYDVTETYSGGQWTVSTPSAIRGLDLRHLSCWAAGGCMATDGSSIHELQGTTWSTVSFPAMGISGLSCPEADSCVAVGWTGQALNLTQSAILRQSGSGWTRSTVPVPTEGHWQELTAVSCGGAGSCIAVGWDKGPGSGTTAIAVTIDAASAIEAPLVEAPGDVAEVSCATRSWCYAGGGEVYSNGSWSTTADGPYGASCPGVDECVAPGNGEWFAVYDGVQWNTESIPANQAPATTVLSGVSCWSAGQCVAGGSTYRDQQTTALTISRDGGNWLATGVRANYQPRSLTSVTCPTGTRCVAADGSDVLAVADGTRWKLSDPIYSPPGVSLKAVSCWASLQCVAVGSSTTRGGRPVIVDYTQSQGLPSVLSLPTSDGKARLTDVSCTSATRCAAVGSATVGQSTRPLVAWTTGSTWQHESLGSGVLKAVSCPPSGSCVAVGTRVGHDMVASQTGSGWKATVSSVPTHAPPTTLSCPARSTCWSTANTGPNSLELVSVSPTNARAVRAISETGQYTASLTGISCPTTSSCTVVGTGFGPRGSVGLVGLFDPS